MLRAGVALMVVLVLALGAVVTYRETRHRSESRNLGREVVELRAALDEMRSLRTEDRAFVRGALGKLERERHAAPPAPATSGAPAAEPQPPDAEDDPASLAHDENPLERARFAEEQAVERVGNQLDERVAHEPVDAPWAGSMTSAIAAAVRDVPGNRVASSDCRSKLCRVSLEHTSADEQFHLARAITNGAPFDADTLFRYDRESTPPRTTVYVMRKGFGMARFLRDGPRAQN